MATFTTKNMSNYEHGQGFIRGDHTHGTIKDGDSTQASCVWGGDDLGRMIERTFSGSRVEVRPGPTSLKGSWNPSEPTIVERIIARLKEAGINLFFRPGTSASDLADLLAKGFYHAESTNPKGGHDVRLLLADCLAELNASIYKPEDLCRCTNTTDGVSKANECLFDMFRIGKGSFFYGEIYHTHGTPAELYTLQIKVVAHGPTICSRPRLTPFGALSELPRLLPENKTKAQLEAIDAMYELIGSPWRVWP